VNDTLQTALTVLVIVLALVLISAVAFYLIIARFIMKEHKKVMSDIHDYPFGRHRP
jgi:phage shock protein PspC (stress-responsive transcriptional regulator)